MATSTMTEPRPPVPAFLVQGLAALSRAGRSGWFDGHIGAAMIALGLFETENRLPRETRYLVRRQRTLHLTRYADYFALPTERSPKIEGTGPILAALRPHLGRLATSGHGVIFGALALRSLDAAPEMATEHLVDGITTLLGAAALDRPDRYFGRPDYHAATTEIGADQPGDPPTYGSSLEMIRAALRALDLVQDDAEIDGRRYYFAGEKLHAVTHAQALCLLEDLGHGDLARAGFAGHRRQLELNRQEPPGDHASAPRRPYHLTPIDPGFWDGPLKDAHTFKLAYAGHDLLRRLPAAERVRYFAGLARFWGD